MRLRAATAPSESGAQRRAFVIERGGLCRPFFTSGSRTRALRSVDQGGLDFLRPVAAVGWWLVLVGRNGKAGPGCPVPLDLGGQPFGPTSLCCSGLRPDVQFTSFAALTAFRARRVSFGGARFARWPQALRCSPPPTRVTGHPGPALHQQRWRANRRSATNGGGRGGRYPPRVSRSRRGTEDPGGARAARIDIKTPGECLSENERSE